VAPDSLQPLVGLGVDLLTHQVRRPMALSASASRSLSRSSSSAAAGLVPDGRHHDVGRLHRHPWRPCGAGDPLPVARPAPTGSGPRSRPVALAGRRSTRSTRLTDRDRVPASEDVAVDEAIATCSDTSNTDQRMAAAGLLRGGVRVTRTAADSEDIPGLNRLAWPTSAAWGAAT